MFIEIIAQHASTKIVHWIWQYGIIWWRCKGCIAFASPSLLFFAEKYKLNFNQEIGNVLAMQRFKAFLDGSAGEKILLFWLAAERYRRQTAPECRRFALRVIQEKFVRQGACLELPNCIKSSFISNSETWAGNGKSMATFKDTTSDVLIAPQSMALAALTSYWLPKYLSHRSLQREAKQIQWIQEVQQSSSTSLPKPVQEQKKDSSFFYIYQNLKKGESGSLGITQRM